MSAYAYVREKLWEKRKTLQTLKKAIRGRKEKGKP